MFEFLDCGTADRRVAELVTLETMINPGVDEHCHLRAGGLLIGTAGRAGLPAGCR